jgi:hypothetical protein
VVLALLQVVAGDVFWRCALDSGIAIGLMTISAHMRDPFIWIAEKLRPPSMWGTMLNGPAAWAEVAQGGLLWTLAVIL